MKTGPIAVVINPKAGKRIPEKIRYHIIKHLDKLQVSYSVFKEIWPDNFDGFSNVWIIGGDGTLNYFLNKYRDIQIPLAIFKGGTGNDFAWKLYGDISLEEQLLLVLNNKAKQVDAGICNGKIFVNTIGIGFDGNILRSMRAVRLLGGHIGYFLVVLKQIFLFREHHFSIYAEGNLIRNEKLLLLEISNSSRTGGAFFISPYANITDGLLNLITCVPLSVIKRLFLLPKIEKGRHLHLTSINSFTGKKFIVECNKVLPAQCDGELMIADRFEISVLEKKFSFIFQDEIFHERLLK